MGKAEMGDLGARHKPKKQATSVEADDAFWYKRFPHKARAGFRGLNMEQKGFYAELIELCFELRGPLADNDVENARTFGCDIRQFRRVKAELLELERVKVEEGTLYDERAIRELVRAGLYSETQARRAKTRWRKKHGAPPRVVLIADYVDLGPTIPATVAATVAGTVERNVHRTPNEINAPKYAEEKRREDIETTSSGARVSRRPPLNRGGASIAQNNAPKDRAAFLEEQRRKLGLDTEKPSEDPPGDRTARRSA